MKTFKWTIGELLPQRHDFATALNVPPLVAQAVLARGMDTIEKATAFLTPSLHQLHDPFSIPNMQRAAERIIAAIKAKDKIVVYGDYDVDGITGTVTLLQTIRMYGGTADFFIPTRGEGYGLHEGTLKKIIDEGAKLIVSVDCGVTGIEPAKVAKAAGIDLIITDHHEAKETFPDCYAIVHPRFNVNPETSLLVDAGSYPNGMICGSGVAFKLSLAIGKLLGGGRVGTEYAPFFAQVMAYTALGTIADVVPLVGENRAIAAYGMQRMPTTCFDGLKALIGAARLDGKEIDGYKIGFSLAPRLNAAGRMGTASKAAKMFLCENYSEAMVIAEELEKQNQARQLEERKIVKDAEAQYHQLIADGKPTDVIIVQCSAWHAGVVGIVSSRLSEKFHKPSIVLVRDGGSGRSVEGFSIIAAVKAGEQYLTRFGGHEAACGIHLKEGCLEQFREAVCAYAREHLTAEMKNPDIKIECEATLEDMTEVLVTALQRVGPFGNSNRRPFFVFRNISIVDVKRMGKEGQFLMFYGKQGERAMKFVTFKPADDWFKLEGGNLVDVVAEPILNDYKGTTSVEMQIRDVKLSGNAQTDNIPSLL